MKPDAHSVFSRVLNEAIGALPEQTSEAREEVYRKVRLFLVTSRHAHMGRQLEEAIAKVEATFAEPTSEAGTQVDGSAPTGGGRAAAILAMLVRHGSRKVLAAGAAVALALGALGIYFSRSPEPDPEFDRGISAYSDNTQSVSPISTWSSYYTPVVEGDERYVQVNGIGPLYAIATVEIDPQASYEVSARVRVIKDDPASSGSVFSIGAKPYGDLGSPEGYQFHDFADTAKSVVVKAEQGWVTITGVLSGIGEAPGQFHKGTRYVRAAALMNQSSPSAVAQIDYLRIRQLPK
jgi:hypothetical protein